MPRFDLFALGLAYFFVFYTITDIGFGMPRIAQQFALTKNDVKFVAIAIGLVSYIVGSPGRFGNWKTVYNRHRRWSGDGTWEKILDALRAGCDEAEGRGWTVAVDATVVRVHQHAAGARHRPPADIDPARLAPAELSTPARFRG